MLPVLLSIAGAGRSGPEGKTFSSTGAWALSSSYVRASIRRCDLRRDPGMLEVECSYKLDRRLAECLSHFFRGRSVTELGAGVGRYKRVAENSRLVGQYSAYDGLSNVSALTRGRVEYADLTIDQPFNQSDFTLSLEVAEHVPKAFEPVLLRNFNRSNRMGIVLSWSNLGSSQSKHGHVNPRRNSQVREVMAPFGLTEDRNASAYLRRCAVFPYFKRGIQVRSH